MRIFTFFLFITMLLACNTGGDKSQEQQETNDTAWLAGEGLLENQVQPQTFNETDTGQNHKNKHYLTVREGEIDTFIMALAQVQVIRQEGMQEMDNAILETGLTLKEFGTYMRKKESNVFDESSVSATKLEKLKKAEQGVNGLQTLKEKQMEDAVEALGMSMERYIHIGMVSEQNEELAKSIQARLQQFMKPVEPKK